MDPRSEASYSSTDTCENEPDNLPLPDDATIPDLMNHLGSTEWYEFTSNLLQETVGDRSVKAMVCLGIGSMEKHRASRIQFAVAMLLADHLGIERSSVMVYDPVMTQDDEDVVRTLGYRVGRNELDFRPTRKSDEAVLLYMPKIPIFVVTDVLSHIRRKRCLANTICFGSRYSVNREIFRRVFDMLGQKQHWFLELLGSAGQPERSCDEPCDTPLELYLLAVTTFADDDRRR